jgi:hypothetical protein
MGRDCITGGNLIPGGRAPMPPDPAPGRPIKAAKGLSIGGAEGSTKYDGSPTGEDNPGREAPPDAVPAEACRRACMNCCCCSGSHAEGL